MEKSVTYPLDLNRGVEIARHIRAMTFAELVSLAQVMHTFDIDVDNDGGVSLAAALDRWAMGMIDSHESGEPIAVKACPPPTQKRG